MAAPALLRNRDTIGTTLNYGGYHSRLQNLACVEDFGDVTCIHHGSTARSDGLVCQYVAHRDRDFVDSILSNKRLHERDSSCARDTGND